MTAARLVLLIPLASGLAVFLAPQALSQPTPPLSSAVKAIAAPAVTTVRQPTEIDAKGFLGVIGQNITPHATLKNKATGAPIAGKRLAFTIRGNAAGSALTDASGAATIQYHVPAAAPGNWPVEIRYDGGLEWLASSASVTMGVFQASTKLTVKENGCCWNDGDTLSLTGKLVRTSDGDGVEGRAVTMTVNGKAAGTPATGNGGSLSFTYKLPSGTAPKARIQAQFEGDTLYAASAATLDVAVSPPRKNATFHMPNERLKGRRGDTITVKGLILPENPMLAVNGAVGGIKINFTARTGQNDSLHVYPLCSGVTFSDGRIECAVKLVAPARYLGLDGHVSQPQNEWAISGTAFQQLEIVPAPVHMAATGPASARVGQTIHVKVRVTQTTDNAPVANAHVALDVPGVPAADTNAVGEVTFTFAVASSGGIGNRALKATTDANDLHEKGTDTMTLQVLPSVS